MMKTEEKFDIFTFDAFFVVMITITIKKTRFDLLYKVDPFIARRDRFPFWRQLFFV